MTNEANGPGGTLTRQVLAAARQTAATAGQPARDMAAACLLDWTGCAVAGATDPLVDKLVADALEFGAPGVMPLVGRAEQVGLREVVLVNGAAGHALDYDDGLYAMIAHPSVTVAPALLGLSAHLGRSGAELVSAWVLALEFGGRTGLALSYSHYRRGFHGTGTVGAMAVAAGCGALLRLDEGHQACAIGLAATRAAGLKASFGTEAKPLHAGWGALIGLTAAQWAARGYTGAPDVFGNPAGLAAFTDDFDPARALAEGEPHILGVQFKRFASCGLTHQMIAAIHKLRDEMATSPEKIAPENIARVTVRVLTGAGQTCNLQAVSTGLEAKFSLRMVAAMALSGIDLGDPASFADAVAVRPDLQALMGRITVELRDELTEWQGEVVVETIGGEHFSSSVDMAKSDPAEQRRAVRPKFEALAGQRLGAVRAQELGARITAIDSAEPVAGLLEAMRA